MSETYMSLPEIQAILKDMLKFVDRICKEEDIQYFLSGGTLLGAVRHQGFIPWDDDADLMMMRPEFERFLEIAPKYATERYAVAHCRTTEGYLMPWIRIWDLHTHVKPSKNVKIGGMKHLFIDIFPIDALPTNPKLSNLFFKWIRVYDAMFRCSRRSGYFYDGERLQWLKRILMKVSSIRTPQSWSNAMDRAAGSGNLKKARYAGVVTVTHYGSRERMPIEVFRGTVPVTFEGESYPAPIGWETYLRGLYGDYMQLPPEDKRYSDHNLKVTMVSGEDNA